MDIGYIRVSSYDQHTDRQLDGIHLEKIYTDMISGKDTNRPELQKCLTALQHGDTLHVHSIDRLTRNLQDLLLLLSEMAERGVTVRFHKEKLTFSSDSSPFQKLHLQIIGAVAEFERAFIRERQREGIAIAKAQACAFSGATGRNLPAHCKRVREPHRGGIWGVPPDHLQIAAPERGRRHALRPGFPKRLYGPAS